MLYGCLILRNPRYLIIQYRKAVYCRSAYNTLPCVLCAKFVSVPGGDISSRSPPRHDGHSLNAIPKSLSKKDFGTQGIKCHIISHELILNTFKAQIL